MTQRTVGGPVFSIVGAGSVSDIYVNGTLFRPKVTFRHHFHARSYGIVVDGVLFVAFNEGDTWSVKNDNPASDSDSGEGQAILNQSVDRVWTI